MKINNKITMPDCFWRIISLFPVSQEASVKGIKAYTETPLMEEIEPRLLFSADPISGLLGSQDANYQSYDPGFVESQLVQTDSLNQASTVQSVTREIIFIDAGVGDYQQLLADLQSQEGGSRQFEVYLLDSDRDGIEQISELLGGHQQIDAIHILSHGDSGRINLGNSWLDINNLDQYSDAIAGWSQVLGDEADLLIYGCNLAGSETGQTLTQSLSDLTGADVAASDDLTGQAVFGGDWALEYSTGNIETDIAFSQQLQQDWGHLLNISIDATSTGTTPTAGTSGTVSHTATGTNRLMLVGISFGQDKGDSVSSITYNGVNLSFVGAQDNSIPLGSRVEIWQLAAPDTGTHDVVVNYSGTSHIGATIGVTTFTDVDQSTPLGAFVSSEGDSSAPSTTVASSTGELVFGVLAADHNADIDLVPGSGQTEHWDLFQDKATGSGTTEAGATSVETSWSLPLILKWAAAGVSINPVDEAPVADAGGPYSINEGDSLNLDASASFDPNTDPLTYEWDLSYDGVTFNTDLTGVTQNLNWAALQGKGIVDDGSYPIAVRVNDGQGNVDIDPTTLTVINTAPTLSATGATTVSSGSSYTLNLSASDPGDDTITSWTINWGDGNIDTIAGNSNSVTYTYTNSGFTNNITVSATDEDNPDSYIHNDLFVGHYVNDAGVYRVQGDWGNSPVEFANEGTLDKTIQPIVGPDGYLYVSGESSKNVLRYHADTGVFFDEFVSTATGGITEAGGITFGPNGNLYVADFGADSVREYDAAKGNYLGDFITSGSATLTQPYSLVFGPSGDLYVGSYNQNTVYRYDGSTGTPVDSGHPGSIGTFIPSAQNGGLGTIEQILFGPDGNLYVADLNNNRVLRFDGDTGIFINIFVAANANGLDKPNGLAFGPDGHLYVTDSQDGVILRFDGTDGSSIDEYVTGLDKPSHLAFAPDLQVWVNPIANTPPTANAGGPYTLSEGGSLNLDASASTDPETDPLTYEWDLNYDGVTFNVEATGEAPTLSWAALQGVSVDDDGTYTIAVRADDGQGNVTIGQTTLTIVNTAPTLSATGASSITSGTFYTLNLSASDPGDDTISSWTINWGDHTIETIAANSAPVTHVYNENGFTRNITTSATDEDGTWTSSDLIVGNFLAGSENIHRFDGSTGEFDSTFSSSTGEVDRPYHAIAGPDGNFYVSGRNSDNVVRYDSSGAYLGEFIAPGSGGLSNPNGLAFGPGGKLYVANAAGNNILRFDSNGDFLNIFGSGGDLDRPTGITWGSNGNLYVASWNNSKVVSFDGTLGGIPITEINSGLSNPEQITFDGAGNLYIANAFGSNVKKWDGTALTTYYSDPSLSLTFGMTFGPDGQLYISNYNSDQIVRFDGATSEVFVTPNSGGLDQPAYLGFTPALQVLVNAVANNSPTLITLSNSNINENINTTGGTSIGTLSTSDPDSGDTTTYSIQGGADASVFTIGGATLDELIFDDGVLNFEMKATYDVIVRVTDSGGLTHDESFTINVNDLNDAPIITSPITANVAENTTAIHQVTATDADLPGDTLTFSIAGSGNDDLLFSIDGSGNLSFIAAPDYEAPTDAGANNIYNIDVAVFDGANQSTASLTVTLSNINEAVSGASRTVSTLEDTDYVFSITDFGFSDPIDGDNLLAVKITTLPGAGALTLVGAGAISAGDFISRTDIDANKLVFTPSSNVSGAGYASFTFQVQDNGGTANGGVDLDQSSDTMTIDVISVNDAPVTNNVSVSGNEDDASIAITLSGSDADGTVNNFQLSSLPANGSLYTDVSLTTVVATGVDYTATAEVLTLYFAPDLNWNGVTSFQFEAKDDGGLRDARPATVTLTVTAVNDVPVATTNTVTTNEDTAYTFGVGDFTYTDAESDSLVSLTLNNLSLAGGTLLHSGSTAVTNSVTLSAAEVSTLTYTPANNAIGLVVATFDFIVNDAGTGITSAQMVMNVSSVNDAPTAISITNNLIQNATNTSAGSTIGTLSAEDVDSNDTATYSIAGGADAGKFSIGGPGLQSLILNNGVLDTNIQSSYEVVVRVTDSGGLSHDENITVIVLDANNISQFLKPDETAVGDPVIVLPDTPTDEPPAETGQDDTIELQLTTEPEYQIGGSVVSTPPAEEITETEQINEEEVPPAKSESAAPADLTDEDVALLINSELDTDVRKTEQIDKIITNQQTLQPTTENNIQARKVNDEFVHATINLNALEEAVNLESFMNALDELREDSENSTLLQQNIAASSMVLTTGLSAGYIIWLVRGGVLLSSILSSLPAWRFIDPMPILAARNGDEDDEDTETLESMIRDGGKIVEEKRSAEGRSEPDQATALEKDTE